MAAWIAVQERLQDYTDQDAVDWTASIIGDPDGFRAALAGMGFKRVKRGPKKVETTDEPARAGVGGAAPATTSRKAAA